jgi:hypothetical protein
MHLPLRWENADELTEFFLSEGDRVLTVRVKPKQFKRLTSHDYEDWMAAIAGSLGPATTTGFELANASIQVFEKKAQAAEDHGGKGQGGANAEVLECASTESISCL